jgi:hypothetical protein
VGFPCSAFRVALETIFRLPHPPVTNTTLGTNHTHSESTLILRLPPETDGVSLPHDVHRYITLPSILSHSTIPSLYRSTSYLHLHIHPPPPGVRLTLIPKGYPHSAKVSAVTVWQSSGSRRGHAPVGGALSWEIIYHRRFVAVTVRPGTGSREPRAESSGLRFEDLGGQKPRGPSERSGNRES